MTHWPLDKFHGGIHPPENKSQSNQGNIQYPPLPKRLIVPVLQHAGQPAEPCVEIGNYVYKGQLIAQNMTAISASVHAPSSGTVTAIGPAPYPHQSGEPYLAIEIHTDGLDLWQEPTPEINPSTLTSAEIFHIIQQSGIVGLGGAGFPTAIKLSGKIMSGIDSLIINGTECEPYITADDLLMRERADKILAGVDILVQLTRPKNVLIATEDNKPEALASMQAALGSRAYQVVSIPTLYPSGGERQLIKILTGQEVPSGSLPIDLGIICQNVGTAEAIYNAVVLGRPLISRVTTLTGTALKQPMNVECLLGTPIEELLEFAGLDKQQLSKVIVGGPMMGFSLGNLAAPVIKTTNCLIAGTAQEFPSPEAALPCIRCGECEQVCPSNLLPQQLLFFAMGEQHEQLKAYNLPDCIECGACAYVCSSKIPLVQYYRAAKADIRQHEQKMAKAEHAKQRYELRQERLRLEEEQKAAERQARNERLARVKAAQEQAAKQEAQQAQSTGSISDDELKHLKIAASMAQVALRKAEKQLALHDTEALQTQVASLKDAAKQAQDALAAAQAQLAQSWATSSPAAAPDEALKKAKIQLAMRRAAVKKAEKAETDEASLNSLRQALQQAQQQLEQLNQTHAKASSTENTSTEQKTAAVPISDAMKKAKIELAMRRAALKKAEKAGASADELTQLQLALSEAEKNLAQVSSPNNPG